MNLVLAIGASVAISLISLIGIIGLIIRGKLLNKLLLMLISFSAGALIGGAFLHLIPEAAKENGHLFANTFAIAGFVLFFILERYLYWRHCHSEKCEIHVFTYLNLVGDGVHNFMDGLIIGSSFAASTGLGVAASVAIIAHEIPQEIGDFGVLVYGGFSKKKALFYNFLSGTTAILGTVIGFGLASASEVFLALLLPLAAGGFIYIASCDLIPELHKEKDFKKATISMAIFILGIALMYVVAPNHH